MAFMDLPAAVLLAVDTDADSGDADRSDASVRQIPIAVLAEVAGYDDPERWWEDVIENRRDGDPFDAVTGRDDGGPGRPAGDRPANPAAGGANAQDAAGRAEGRRAADRGGLRCVARPGADRRSSPTVTADNALLRGLPTAKVTATWVPWTHSRLAVASGYGAGVDSPGWYHHLFTETEHGLERWMTRSAGVLAPARPADIHRPRHRGRPAGARPGPTPWPPGTGPDRGDRRDPRSAVRGQRDCRRVRPARSGRRRATRQGPGHRADGSAGGGPAYDREVVAAEI